MSSNDDRSNNRLSRLLLSYGAGIFGKKETSISEDNVKRKWFLLIVGISGFLVLLGVLVGILLGLNAFTSTKDKTLSRGLCLQ